MLSRPGEYPTTRTAGRGRRHDARSTCRTKLRRAALLHRGGDSPLDQRDLEGVVDHEARHHRITEDGERLPPRQRHESRETHERQNGSRQRIGREGLARHRRPEPAALARGHDGECGEVEQRQEAEGMEGVVVRREAEARPPDPQEKERLGDHRDSQHRGHDDEAPDLPGLRLPGRSYVIGGQGDLGEVGHEDEQQHREGGDHELAGDDERDGHEGRLQDRPADLVDDPRQDSLVDDPALLDERHNVRQPRLGQHDAGGALDDVGRGADGDADLGLAKGGRVVDTVARHAGHVAGRLQMLNDDVFVLGEHFGEAVGPGQEIDRLVSGLGAGGLKSAMRRMFGRPTPRAISVATASASPVSILTETPRPRSAAMSCPASGRGGSYRVTRPTSAAAPVSGPRATARVRKPFSAASPTRASNASTAGGWSPQASATVRTAPFITRSRCPFCSTTASVRRFFASNGAKETGATLATLSKTCRSFAAARNARSIGSWLASCDASAPANRTSASVACASGITPVTASWFIVIVPVLSTQSTSIVAASSAALSRVTSTPSLASSFDPTAMLTVNMTGRATGTALISRTSMSETIWTSGVARTSDSTTTTPSRAPTMTKSQRTTLPTTASM